jgi:hypothetical protein
VNSGWESRSLVQWGLMFRRKKILLSVNEFTHEMRIFTQIKNATKKEQLERFAVEY